MIEARRKKFGGATGNQALLTGQKAELRENPGGKGGEGVLGAFGRGAGRMPVSRPVKAVPI